MTQPTASKPTSKVERKGKYALTPPQGANDWWEINDMEKMYSIVTVQAEMPSAEEIMRFAWGRLTAQPMTSKEEVLAVWPNAWEHPESGTIWTSQAAGELSQWEEYLGPSWDDAAKLPPVGRLPAQPTCPECGRRQISGDDHFGNCSHAQLTDAQPAQEIRPKLWRQRNIDGAVVPVTECETVILQPQPAQPAASKPTSKEEKIAYVTDEYRNHRVRGIYLLDESGLARVEILRGEQIMRTGKVQAYKIWNYSAHAHDIVDEFLADLPAQPQNGEHRTVDGVPCVWNTNCYCGHPFSKHTSLKCSCTLCNCTTYRERGWVATGLPVQPAVRLMKNEGNLPQPAQPNEPREWIQYISHPPVNVDHTASAPAHDRPPDPAQPAAESRTGGCPDCHDNDGLVNGQQDCPNLMHDRLMDLASVMYQIAGANLMPLRVMDMLSVIQRGAWTDPGAVLPYMPEENGVGWDEVGGEVNKMHPDAPRGFPAPQPSHPAELPPPVFIVRDEDDLLELPLDYYTTESVEKFRDAALAKLREAEQEKADAVCLRDIYQRQMKLHVAARGMAERAVARLTAELQQLKDGKEPL
jgi:hypothetical protein